MGQITLQTPVIGQPNATEAPKIVSDFTTIQTVINGNLDGSNLSAAFAAAAGVNGATTVKGSSIIATSQSTSSTTFTTLATPDQVQNIVVPTNGLIEVNYQATWQESVANSASAVICLNGTPVQIATRSGSPVGASAAIQGTAGTPMPLSSCGQGLKSMSSIGISYTGDVTTGQVIGVNDAAGAPPYGHGGPCKIFAAAGTYTVSVQFAATSGAATVSNRRLYVQVITYG